MMNMRKFLCLFFELETSRNLSKRISLSLFSSYCSCAGWVFGRDSHGNYREFRIPKAVNEDVASIHRFFTVTIVGIITTLVITASAAALLRNLDGRSSFADSCRPSDPIVMRGLNDTCTDSYARGEALVSSNLTDCCSEGDARGLLCDRINHFSKKRIWAEAYPEATCGFCIIIWLITYPLLYINKQWLQRCIYFLIITSKIFAISSLLVRPLLIYLIPEFLWSVGIVSLAVCISTLVFLYLEDRNHQR